MRLNIKSSQEGGFTIVELLVVIVVIGILAAITLVSYINVTNRANTASGQSDAGTFMNKASTFAADNAVNFPTTYADITSAPNTKVYFGTGYNFTLTSSVSNAAPGLMTNFRAAGITNDALDFILCGTANGGAAPGMYSGITIPTGFKIGYWDFVANSENTTTYNVGTVSTGNIQCYKVGLAEAVMAVVMAAYQDNGSWPTSAATLQNYTTTPSHQGVVLPANTTISGIAGGGAINSGNGTTTVDFNCINTGCANGGRIMYWDYSTGGSGTLSTAATSLYYNGATSAGTFQASP
jgi:prepilin-type N-terminal cleavage/methylation domain-containing protein